MRTRSSVVLSATVAVSSLLAPLAARASAPVDLVVDLADTLSDADVQHIAHETGTTLRPNSYLAPVDRIFHATVDGDDADRILARLRALPGVSAAEREHVFAADLVPNDPDYDVHQWHMKRVHAPLAWDTTCGRGVRVAVIDTGVACENHGEFTRLPDLAETRCEGGYDFVNDDTHPNDDQGHGTHVAGTIAQSTGNALGAAGLAYCATVVPVKVLDAYGRGSLADVAEGIRYAADQGAQIINLSLGGDGHSRVMDEAVAYARAHGSVVVCAAGNNAGAVGSPANSPGAVAVSASDPGDDLAYFSSRGPEIAIAAPGVNVYQQTICNHGVDRCEQFAAWSGTSMASPHVAGVAALVASLGITDPGAIESILKSTATRPITGATDPTFYGAGIVDAAGAVKLAEMQLAFYRALAFALVLGFIAWRVKARQGVLAPAYAWIGPAVLAGIGLPFLSLLVPHTVPLVDFAMRPLGDWSLLLGAGVHRWLPFANAGVVLVLVALGFSRPRWRAPIGGLALGTGSYLLATLAGGVHTSPFTGWLATPWLLANALVCLWIARIALDRKTAA